MTVLPGLERHESTLQTIQVGLVPAPYSIVPLPGEFRISSYVLISAPPEQLDQAEMLSDLLLEATGIRCLVTPSPGSASHSGRKVNTLACSLKSQSESQAIRRFGAECPTIVMELAKEMNGLGHEGYTLDITPKQITLCASSNAGLYYGAQTLAQMAAVSEAPSLGVAAIPCVEITDYPRFAWRGAMLDLARWFVPPAFIYKFIDLLGLHKMNVLHLHLNDDQGWRVEIKKYPKLTSVGGYRKQSFVGQLRQDPADDGFDPSLATYDGVPHGGFYTQKELRDLVEYAAWHNITLVPEIDLPGHAQAAIAAYTELGCEREPVEVSCSWGIHPYVFNPSEETMRFLEDVLQEVLEIFPSQYIHVGGDEVVTKQWQESPECQTTMRALGLAGEDEIKAYFTRRMGVFLAEHGRRLVGWDEILEGELCPDAVVMSWRGEEGGVDAARSGRDVVMAPYQHTYFDYRQAEDTAIEPLGFPHGFTTLSAVYHYEPVPRDLPLEHVHHVLGCQGQLWTEYMPDVNQIEYMAFPRMCALAEVAWSPAARRDFGEFMQRLRVHLARLDAKNVNYRKLDRYEPSEEKIEREYCC